MSIQDFLTPISKQKLINQIDIQDFQIGNNLEIYHSESHFPVLDDGGFQIAIFGVIEERRALKNEGCAYAPDFFRKQFYQLFTHDETIKIADLGNVLAGKTIENTYFAVKEITAYLMRLGILPIIIGGGQDVTFAQYSAHESMEEWVDLVCIDATLDMQKEEVLHSQSFVYHIIKHEPNYLFNFCNIGYQRFLESKDHLKTMDDLFFDAHRLGEASSNLEGCEPLVRNANILSIDMAAIRASDAPGNAKASPNGFYGEDICKLCRYAGMSDKLNSIGIYEYNPTFDTKHFQTAQLMAQMVWYVIDGFIHRKKEFPTMAKDDFYIYKTLINNHDSEVIFIKSRKSERWWLQVPFPNGHFTNGRYHWVPCRYEDYAQAADGHLPDIWWKTYQKLR